jgi:oxygen-independent coproporphyrinogen-3 oxidase
MCHLFCDVGALVDEFDHRQESFEQEFQALLRFVADGYIRIDGDRIFVSERGRPYLRLIAAAFDRYLPNSRARHSIAV